MTLDEFQIAEIGHDVTESLKSVVIYSIVIFSLKKSNGVRLPMVDLGG